MVSAVWCMSGRACPSEATCASHLSCFPSTCKSSPAGSTYFPASFSFLLAPCLLALPLLACRYAYFTAQLRNVLTEQMVGSRTWVLCTWAKCAFALLYSIRFCPDGQDDCDLLFVQV